MNGPRFLVTGSPHIASDESTPSIMRSVILSLLPIIIVAAYFFGISALLVIAAATAGTTLIERFFGRSGSLRDGSGIITGLLLGLTLPAGIPLWMAFLGGAFGVAFGKLVFGGLGQNVFNPALLGRAFLQAAFPVVLTTWPMSPASFFALCGDNFAVPLMAPVVDTITGATPLGMMKFEGTGTGFMNLLIGNTRGSLGETSGALILLCGGYLAYRRHIDWRVPLSILVTVGLSSFVLHAGSNDYPSAPFMLFSGGLLLGAVYMATDMVTSPVTPLGAWIFGIGIGLLVVVIRLWGGLAEGVMYAILLMNALVPFIDRATQPRVFGTQPRRSGGAA